LEDGGALACGRERLSRYKPTQDYPLYRVMQPILWSLCAASSLRIAGARQGGAGLLERFEPTESEAAKRDARWGRFFVEVAHAGGRPCPLQARVRGLVTRRCYGVALAPMRGWQWGNAAPIPIDEAVRLFFLRTPMSSGVRDGLIR
jgi:hypothetical protein